MEAGDQYSPEGPLPRIGRFRIHIAQFVFSSKATGLATCDEAEAAEEAVVEPVVAVDAGNDGNEGDGDGDHDDGTALVNPCSTPVGVL